MRFTRFKYVYKCSYNLKLKNKCFIKKISKFHIKQINKNKYIKIHHSVSKFAWQDFINKSFISIFVLKEWMIHLKTNISTSISVQVEKLQWHHSITVNDQNVWLNWTDEKDHRRIIHWRVLKMQRCLETVMIAAYELIFVFFLFIFNWHFFGFIQSQSCVVILNQVVVVNQTKKGQLVCLIYWEIERFLSKSEELLWQPCERERLELKIII